MIKKLTKALIIIGCIAVVEVTIYYCICEIDRRIQEKERATWLQRSASSENQEAEKAPQ